MRRSSRRRYDAGYLSWSLNANRPTLHMQQSYLRRSRATVGTVPARRPPMWQFLTWIGSYGFYPDVISRSPSQACAHRRSRAGAGGLLIHLLEGAAS